MQFGVPLKKMVLTSPSGAIRPDLFANPKKTTTMASVSKPVSLALKRRIASSTARMTAH